MCNNSFHFHSIMSSSVYKREVSIQWIPHTHWSEWDLLMEGIAVLHGIFPQRNETRCWERAESESERSETGCKINSDLNQTLPSFPWKISEVWFMVKWVSRNSPQLASSDPSAQSGSSSQTQSLEMQCMEALHWNWSGEQVLSAAGGERQWSGCAWEENNYKHLG